FKKEFSGEASLGVMNSSLAGKTDPQLSALLNWKNPDNTVGVLLQLFDQKQHLRRDGVEVLGYFPINLPATAGTTIINGTAQPATKLNGVLSPTLIGSALFEQERHRQGGALE